MCNSCRNAIGEGVINAKAKALNLKKELSLEGSLDIYDVAQEMGLEIDFVPLRSDLHEITVGSNIAVSTKIDAPSQRWAVAHAIGHIVLHGSRINQLWLRAHTLLTDKIESDAERFAYHLLTDRRDIYDQRMTHASEIAEYFGIPTQMVEKFGDS